MENRVEFKYGMKVFNPKNKEYGVITTISAPGLVDEERNANVVGVLSNTVIVIPLCVLEIAADTIYKPGDLVESVLGGGFIGKVIGFDELENRVICLSTKASQSKTNRIRYSYGLDELRPYVKPEKTYVVNRGSIYLVNNQTSTICIEDYTNPGDRRLLVELGTGKAKWVVPKGKVLESKLKSIGINSITRLSNSSNLV